MTEFNFPVAWQPTGDYIQNANITAQMHKYNISSYEAFLQHSFDDPDWFWRAFFDDIGFEWAVPYRQTLNIERGKPWAEWFVGGELNWTHNALDRHVKAGRGEHAALVWEGEEGDVRRYTYRELLNEVNALAQGLITLGVQPGDRVGLFLPFIPEVAIALLAVSRIGAIALPLFSGFGPEPVQMRLNDADAKWLFVADGFPRRGKTIPMKETADEALRDVPTIEKVIVVNRAGRPVPQWEGRDLMWDSVCRMSPVGEPDGNCSCPAFAI